MNRVLAVIPPLALTMLTIAVMVFTEHDTVTPEEYEPIRARLVAKGQKPKPAVVMRGGYDGDVGQPPLPLAPYRVKARFGDPVALSDLSAVLLEQEHDPQAALEAIVAARTALASNPALAAAHFNLGLALDRVGLRPEARVAFERAAELESDDIWIAQARQHARVTDSDFRSPREIARTFVRISAEPSATEVLSPYLTARQGQRNLRVRRKNANARLAQLAEVEEHGTALIERLLWRMSHELNAREKDDPYAERFLVAGALYGRKRGAEALPLLYSLDGDAYDSKGRAGLDAQLVCEKAMSSIVRGRLPEATAMFDEAFRRNAASREHALATMFADLSRSVRASLMNAAFLRQDVAAAYAYAGDPSLGEPSRSTLAEVQGALAPDAAIIEFSPMHEQVVAFVIRADVVHIVTLDADANLVFGAADFLRNANETNFASRASQMYARVFRPVAERLHGITTVAIVPHRELLGIPFGALFDVDRGEYVYERFKVVHARSADAAISASRRARDARDATLLAVAATTFDDPSVPALASAGEEVLDIAVLSRCARVLSGRDATPEALRRQLVDNATVHYAGHIIRGGGVARLLLAGDTLTTDDIARLPLKKPQVVVLAACRGASTGQPHSLLPNVADAFLAAGVPAVIASSYDVEDAAAPATMRRLHLFLRNGDDPAEALRKTAIAELQRGREVPLAMRFMTMGGTSSLVR